MKARLIMLLSVIFVTTISKGQDNTGINPPNEQKPINGFNVKLFPNPSINKLTLKIHSEKISLNDCEFKMINEKGKVVKTIDLPKANNDLETIISIEDIELGGYWCIITKENKELFKGRFVKDLIMVENTGNRKR